MRLQFKKKNASAIDKEGWLHSGDKGCMDTRGMVLSHKTPSTFTLADNAQQPPVVKLVVEAAMLLQPVVLLELWSQFKGTQKIHTAGFPSNN